MNAAAADIAKGVTEPKEQTSAAAVTGDIALEMVNLMVGHKTYDANGRVVETAAGMLDKIVWRGPIQQQHSGPIKKASYSPSPQGRGTFLTFLCVARY